MPLDEAKQTTLQLPTFVEQQSKRFFPWFCTDVCFKAWRVWCSNFQPMSCSIFALCMATRLNIAPDQQEQFSICGTKDLLDLKFKTQTKKTTSRSAFLLLITLCHGKAELRWKFQQLDLTPLLMALGSAKQCSSRLTALLWIVFNFQHEVFGPRDFRNRLDGKVTLKQRGCLSAFCINQSMHTKSSSLNTFIQTRLKCEHFYLKKAKTKREFSAELPFTCDIPSDAHCSSSYSNQPSAKFPFSLFSFSLATLIFPGSRSSSQNSYAATNDGTLAAVMK